jgi:hypothetical protein
VNNDILKGPVVAKRNSHGNYGKETSLENMTGAGQDDSRKYKRGQSLTGKKQPGTYSELFYSKKSPVKDKESPEILPEKKGSGGLGFDNHLAKYYKGFSGNKFVENVLSKASDRNNENTGRFNSIERTNTPEVQTKGHKQSESKDFGSIMTETDPNPQAQIERE